MKAFCKEAGVPYETIVNQRVQGRYPTVDVLNRFTDIADFSLDWLILGKEYSFEKNVLDAATRIKATCDKEIKLLKSMSI
ncbi:MAG: hypothetical protein K5634_01225 [Sphaerochaetaceae bacterium]|nr:hypothetical protein [Sphaerochaetaceae bacterium]